MNNTLQQWITPLMIIQGIISIVLVATFCFQEITLHSVDPDLKLITFGVVGFWLGGITFMQGVKHGIRSDTNGD